MKRYAHYFLFILFIVSCQTTKKEQKPNIIYILADDLGYGEIGVMGQQKIKTPNIDALAKNGMLFTQHYSGAPVCAPARYSFLTGKHMGHSYIRGNDEWNERGDIWNYTKVFSDVSLEGQRPIPENTLTLGKHLQKAGYTTGLFGKWGLGAPNTEGVPNKQGFDEFYGYNCQRQAHNLYPSHLWENETKVYLNNELVNPHTNLEKDADINNPKSYAKFTDQKDYAPKLIHDKSIAFIRKNKDKPFFMYYASPLPHVPLQVPNKYVEAYRKVFGEEKPYTGKSYFPTQYPNATYAAMISYLDMQIGELVAELKKQGIYENTLIIFTSDNGPTYTGGVDANYFNSARPFDNNYGRTKGFVYEGGIRVPMIASWPRKIKAGTTSNHISAFYDMMPTLSEVVGIKTPKDVDGISFSNTLLGKKQQNHEFLYWEFPSYQGQQAVRMGKWKAIRKNIFKGNLTIELYNLDEDLKEQHNVAQKYPEIVKKMAQIMKQEHSPATNKRFQFTQLGDK
ncbi:MAG: arylsulfatase [Flavobacteriaceae bacterium]|nr:arylsulfatase [Flavobacteriaceae bacterium]